MVTIACFIAAVGLIAVWITAKHNASEICPDCGSFHYDESVQYKARRCKRCGYGWRVRG